MTAPRPDADPVAIADEYQSRAVDPMAIADEIQNVAASLAGLRASLIAQGFTPDQAGDIVVATMQQLAAKELAHAHGRKAMTE